MKNFLNISDLSSLNLREIIEEAKTRKSQRKSLNKSAPDIDQPFAGKSMIMIFEKPSTRTRISFDIAVKQLGGSTIILNTDNIHYGIGDESIKDISIIASDMLKTAKRLFSELEVNKEVMRKNLDLTKGLILSQRVTFYLAEKIGKDTADNIMHEVSMEALRSGITLKEAIQKNKDISKYFSDDILSDLLDPETYIGLAKKQTQLIIKEIEEKRKLSKY